MGDTNDKGQGKPEASQPDKVTHLASLSSFSHQVAGSSLLPASWLSSLCHTRPGEWNGAAESVSKKGKLRHLPGPGLNPELAASTVPRQRGEGSHILVLLKPAPTGLGTPRLQRSLITGHSSVKEVPLTLAAASVSTSKAWESWWKSSATHDKKARGENKMELGSDNGILKKPRSARPANSEQEVYPQSAGHPITWSELGPWLKAGHVCLHPEHRHPVQPPTHTQGTRGPHLLWGYLDFCLGGRRALFAYMPSSPRGVRKQSHSGCLPKTCGDQSIPCTTKPTAPFAQPS